MREATTFLFLVLAFAYGCYRGTVVERDRWESETVKHNAAVWKTLPDGTVEWSWKEESK